MEKTTIELQREWPATDKEALYLVDWNEVKSMNDLVLIIASLGVSFSPHHPGWDMIKHLIDYSNPIKPNIPQEAKPVNLPKLKTL